MAQHEGDLFLCTKVAEPVPGEHALDADDQVVAERGDGLEKGLGIAGQIAVEDDGTGCIEDAQVQSPCMEVDASVESVLLGVESHDGLLGFGWGLSPLRWDTSDNS
jgi:hypothetical protein